MSQTELQRLAAAVQATPALADSYRTAATSAELAARLQADGYDVTEADLTAGVTGSAELSDDQLDGVAGGMFSPDFFASLQAAIAKRR